MTVPGLDPGIVPVIHVGEPPRGIRPERLAEPGERADVGPLDE